MKYSLLPVAATIIAGALSASAAPLPGAPEANGLAPQTATLYINGTNGFIRIHGTNYALNNGNTESLGVGIASSGNVLVGWEDDANGASYTMEVFGRDYEATWTMFDAQGNSITPQTPIYSDYFGESLTNNYLGLFRTNGSPYPTLAILPAVAWGPKIHANLFGAGIGMGASESLLGYEDDRFSPYFGGGGTPVVQLLDGTGQPQNLLAGVTVPYADDPQGGTSELATGNTWPTAISLLLGKAGRLAI